MTNSGVGTGWLSNFTACSNTTLSIEFRDNTLLAMQCFEQSILLCVKQFSIGLRSFSAQCR
jgi:hypothetical protein